MSKKNIIISTLIIILFTIIVLISSYYFFSKNPTVQEIKISNNNTETLVEKHPDWAIFTNDEYSFSLQYPNDFFDVGHIPKTLIGECNYQDFPKTCPNINSIVPDLLNYNDGNITQENTTINNIPYCLSHVSDAATGHVYNSYYYTTIKNNTCFVIFLETSTTNCDFYLPLEENNTEQKTNYEKCMSTNKNQPILLQDIVSSFKFEG